MSKLQDDLEWMLDGACTEVGSEIFFPDDFLVSRNDISHAKKTCRRCPVQETCLEYALTAKIVRGSNKEGQYIEGVWGGTTTSERATIRAERGIHEIEEDDDDEADHYARTASVWEDHDGAGVGPLG